MDNAAYERPLPDREEQVMLALWDCGGRASFFQLKQALAWQGWAPSTLLNFLYRLQERGFLTVEKQGGRNRYRALARRQDYLTTCARRFLGRFWGGSFTAFAGGMLKARALGGEELDSLHALVEQALADQCDGESDLYDPWQG